MAVSAIEYLVLGTEQFLRELPDDEFAALVARCRPPGEQVGADHLKRETTIE
jgi:hypothetical protein